MSIETGEDGDGMDRIADMLESKHRQARLTLLDRGLDAAVATRRAHEVTRDAIDRVAPRLVQDLLDSLDSWADGARREDHDFAERLRTHWGRAFDMYRGIVMAIEEASTRTIRRNRPETAADPLLDALAQLNGQALRVAREIHALLVAGFPQGGLARWRTMHEIAVNATVLARFGREDEHDNLGRRFLDHDFVINAADVEWMHRLDGPRPLDEVDLARVRSTRRELLERYGRDYGAPYGWAVGLPGITNGRRFDELERLARIEHRRDHYRWASHLVHGDAKALRLGLVERGGAKSVLVSATNSGLADAGQHALYSANLTWVSLVIAMRPIAQADLLYVKVVGDLIGRAYDAFVDGERSVAAAERQLQQQLRDEGRGLTPWGIEDLR